MVIVASIIVTVVLFSAVIGLTMAMKDAFMSGTVVGIYVGVILFISLGYLAILICRGILRYYKRRGR